MAGYVDIEFIQPLNLLRNYLFISATDEAASSFVLELIYTKRILFVYELVYVCVILSFGPCSSLCDDLCGKNSE